MGESLTGQLDRYARQRLLKIILCFQKVGKQDSNACQDNQDRAEVAPVKLECVPSFLSFWYVSIIFPKDEKLPCQEGSFHYPSGWACATYPWLCYSWFSKSTLAVIPQRMAGWLSFSITVAS